VKYDRSKIARYGIDIEELNSIIRTAYAGETAGVVFENERRFDLVLRLDNEKVKDLNIDKLFVRTGEGIQIPVSEVASIDLENGPLQINRDATKRRIVIGVNVRDADIQQVVEQIRTSLEKNIKLKPGYYWEYGGQFENLQNAVRTLSIVIPIALMLILLLLFFAFRSVIYSLVVFSTVPLSLIGGVVALWLRGLPFSISAGVGFIALFGVAVLNGILMINHFNDLRKEKTYTMCTNRIIAKGCPHLLRPVFLTGLVASLGFVPMAVATSAGAEVQRPLATVVIGGLIVSTVLTLIVIPVFYRLVNVIAHLWGRKKNLKQQQEDLRKQIQAEKDKKKTDNGKIQQWNEQIESITLQIEDLDRSMMETLAGTDVKTAIDEFADALVDAYCKGEDAAEALGEKTKEVLKKAVVEALKREFLAKGINDAVLYLGESMKDGKLTDVEKREFERMVNAAGDLFNSALEGIGDWIKDVEEETVQQDPLTGAVTSMNEETGGVIAGRLNAFVINQSDQTSIMRQALVYQAEIAANTKLSASELTEIKTTLKRIENKDSSLLSQGIA
jgi:hypothetical protein